MGKFNVADLVEGILNEDDLKKVIQVLKILIQILEKLVEDDEERRWRQDET